VPPYGESYWDQPEGAAVWDNLGTREHATEVLAAAGLPTSCVEALDDTSFDRLLDDETEMAIGRTGREVGTPIITFHPPDGLSFFGPVISRVPSDEDSLRLWDAVIAPAGLPGFAEMKRSLREVPQLNIPGGISDAPIQENWESGHRRGHLATDTHE